MDNPNPNENGDDVAPPFPTSPETSSLDDVLIHVLDQGNNPVKTFAFSRNVPADPSMVYTSQYLHPDDSVYTLKLKLSKAIGDDYQRTHGSVSGNYPPIESMYLYTRRWIPASELDVEKLYQEITKHSSSELTPLHMELFLNNFSIPFRNVAESDMTMDVFLERVQQTMADAVNPLQGLLQLVPIGVSYGKALATSAQSYTSEYTFPVNPYHCTPEVLQEWGRTGSAGGAGKPRLMFNDHPLLLKYMPLFQNEIYVCLAENYAPEVASIYFPPLSAPVPVNMVERAIDRMVTMDTIREYFHTVALNVAAPEVTSKLPRIQREIHNFSLVIQHKIRIPLEILFKNVSATALVPGIVYNPGQNKENILRLYSVRVSKSGKRIPVLEKRKITNFVKFSRRNTVVFYLPASSEPTSSAKWVHDTELYVLLDATGSLYVHMEEPIQESNDILDMLLRERLNPLVDHLNVFLQRGGYALPLFGSVQDDHVRIKHMHVRWSFRHPRFVSILNDLPCVRQLFDVYEHTDTQIVLRYKRPFSDHDAQGILIKEFRRMGKNNAQITEALQLNYSLTSAQIQRRLDEYEVNQEERLLARKWNREYAFPMEIRYEDRHIVVDIFKYCRDCGPSQLQMSETEPTVYVAGPKGRIHKRRPTAREASGSGAYELPSIRFFTMVETYMESLVAVLLHLEGNVPKPASCEKIVFEPPAEEMEEAVPVVVVLPLEEEEDQEEENQEEEDEDDDDEDQEDEEDEEPEEFLFKGGATKKKYKTKLDRLHEQDSELFILEGEAPYSRACQKKRQPVVISQDDYQEFQEKHPDMRAISYSTNPRKQNWYTCPKYWCESENRVLTEEEYQRGECKGNVIVSDEFTNPGFEDPEKHPKGFCTPCCFKGDTTKKRLHVDRNKKCQADLQADKPEPAASSAALKPMKDERVILKYSSNPPVTLHRWMLLPKAVQYFLNVDYSKHINTVGNALRLVPNQPCFLMYGIEHPRRQSFLGLMTDLYNYSHATDPPISISTLRTLLKEVVTLDRFVSYRNGSYISVFGDESSQDNETIYGDYSATALYKSVNPNDPQQTQFFTKTVRAYESFQRYLKDTQTVINHEFLWDILTEPHPTLLPTGCNLIVLELNDSETSVDLLCSPSPQSVYDPRKPSFFVLKRGDYYEPIYQYMESDQGASAARYSGFVKEQLPPTSPLHRILDTVDISSRDYCRTTTTGKNKTAQDTEKLLTENDYTIHRQVWNLEGKLVGFYTHKQGTPPVNGVFVPCQPSTLWLDQDIPAVYINTSLETVHESPQFRSEKMWKSYQQTRIRLEDLVTYTQHQLQCTPKFKVLEPMTRTVIGIMTETSQFVPVFPHEPAVEDDLPILERSDDIFADNTLVLEHGGETRRERFMRNVMLESQFYQIFRSMVRQWVNNYEHRAEKRQILSLVRAYESDPTLYSRQLMTIAMQLEQLSQGSVDFLDYSDQDLDQMAANPLYECYATEPEGQGQSYCRSGVLVIPARHLLAKEDDEDASNRNIYFMRLADELLRFRRIQIFMFQPQTFLNIHSSMNEYVLTPSEILILESFLTDDYYQDMIPFNVSEYIHQTNYDTSAPSAGMADFIPEVSVEEQRAMQRGGPKDPRPMSDCFVKLSEKESLVEGNNRSIWKRSFPKETHEWAFKSDTPACTFAVLANLRYLAGRSPQSLAELKQELWRAYSSYTSLHEAKLVGVLVSQGKKHLLVNGDLQTAIMSEEYFVSDLDIWVLVTYWSLPVVLFSSGILKMIAGKMLPPASGPAPSLLDKSWLFLTSKPELHEDGARSVDNHALVYDSLYFVRSPLSANKQTGLPAYSLIESAFSLNELKEVGAEIQRGTEANTNNFISLERFLRELVVPKRGRTAKA